MTMLPVPPTLSFVAFGLMLDCGGCNAEFGGCVSHGWITLFTTAPVGSVRALLEGVIWSIVFGWIIALVTVPIYNRIAAD